MLGSHLIKSWCRQQKVTALSSAETETYALVCTSCEDLGIAAFGVDFGVAYEIEAYTDAKAALGILQRTGIGKVRHIRTQALWLQECGREKRIQFLKVLGDANPADAQTKHQPRESNGRYAKMCACDFPEGVIEFAFTVKSLGSLRGGGW